MLDKDLPDGGHPEPVGGDFAELFHIRNNPAAGAAERERRADNEREADFQRERFGILQVCDDLGRDDRLADGLHGVLEHLAVLRLVDCFRIRAQEPDAVLI